LYERGFPDEPFDVALRYRTVRVWQVPAEQWLSGGLGLVPLAPLGIVRPGALPAVIAQVKQRLEPPLPPAKRAALWSATYIMMGLRYERELIQRLLQGVISMKESVTYQAILEEGEAKGRAEGEARGEAKEARKILLLLGSDQFGEPSAKVQAAVDALAEVSRLEELTVRLKHTASWEELLGLASPRRRSPRRKPSA
jgi:predicted transposase YdaD